MILALLACATPDYRAADLQLDIAAPLPEAAETLTVCVDGFGEYSAGAGNGRAAVAGLLVGESYPVTVDVYDADGVLLGTAGPTTLDEATPYAVAELGSPGIVPCAATGEVAPAGGESWILAIRFDEEGTPWDQL